MDLLFDTRTKFEPAIQDRIDKLEEKIGEPLEISTGIANCYVRVSLNSYIYNFKIIDRTQIYYKNDLGERIVEITLELIDKILSIVESNVESVKKLFKEVKLSRGRPILH